MEQNIDDLYKYLESKRTGAWMYVPNSPITKEHWISETIPWSFELDKYISFLEDGIGSFYNDLLGGYFQTKRGRIYPNMILFRAKADSNNLGVNKYYVIEWTPNNRIVSIAHEMGMWKNVEGVSGESFLEALGKIDG